MADLNHFHLQTHDLNRSVEFYTKVFGFEFDAKIGQDQAYLKNHHGFFLGLQQVQNLNPLPDWFHFGFGCRSEAELREIRKACIGWPGAEVGEISTSTDLIAFYTADPAGNKIEVFYLA